MKRHKELQEHLVHTAQMAHVHMWCAVERAKGSLRRFVGDRSGQGTTEYAILVGVLVVIAIIAITLFKPKIQELWDAIASGINGL